MGKNGKYIGIGGMSTTHDSTHLAFHDVSLGCEVVWEEKVFPSRKGISPYGDKGGCEVISEAPK